MRLRGLFHRCIRRVSGYTPRTFAARLLSAGFAQAGMAASTGPDEIRSAIGRVVIGVSGRRTPVGYREPDQELLVALLGDVPLTPNKAYRDLAGELRAAIASGEVPVGARLPPQRELARRLSIGRTTVVAAYNLLQAESLLVMRRGAGTWVARRPVPARRQDPL